ncbi:MAG: hypothetical protein C0404_15020 [Verrucomicrobia bacterium]|nr:hypothetical protein [Verrucomicrobiota bacterium]
MLSASGGRTTGKEEMVLCADDDADILRMLDVALECCGYEAILAHDGKQAVDEFRKNKNNIVAVIMDLRMPVMNGFDAARQIRAEAPGILLIALSAYLGLSKDGIQAKQCEEAGFNAWTTKPFSIEPLVEIIRSHTSKQAGTSGLQPKP